MHKFLNIRFERRIHALSLDSNFGFLSDFGPRISDFFITVLPTINQ